MFQLWHNNIFGNQKDKVSVWVLCMSKSWHGKIKSLKKCVYAKAFWGNSFSWVTKTMLNCYYVKLLNVSNSWKHTLKHQIASVTTWNKRSQRDVGIHTRKNVMIFRFSDVVQSYALCSYNAVKSGAREKRNYFMHNNHV